MATKPTDILPKVPLPAWLDTLRREKIIAPIREDIRTQSFPTDLLGVDFNTARDLIGFGQTDFNLGCPERKLNPDDLALLYAYCNQPQHLEELIYAFRQIEPPKEDSIVIDLGCGPSTGGLAFTEAVGPNAEFDYIGLDRATTMRQLGQQLMAGIPSGQAKITTPQWRGTLADVIWKRACGWRPVFVIASYLLASPTLNANDVKELVNGLDASLQKISFGDVLLLYTNSASSYATRNYATFKEALKQNGFKLTKPGHSITSRNKEMQYALFHRPKVTTWKPK